MDSDNPLHKNLEKKIIKKLKSELYQLQGNVKRTLTTVLL